PQPPTPPVQPRHRPPCAL
ncbi:hypothetical protein Aglo02_03870, partial [Actinokineospora globicatena]